MERVAGAATSEFALLPSPNPSGNFTKITQRLPIRVALQPPPEPGPAAARDDGGDRGAVRQGPTERTLEALGQRFGPSYRWLVTITAIIGTVATILSSTIVNVALPDIMGAFGIGQDHAQLLSTGFLAAVTGTMLLNAWLVESFGFRATYAAAVGLFLFGSVVAGFAPNEGHADPRPHPAGRLGGDAAAADDADRLPGLPAGEARHRHGHRRDRRGAGAGAGADRRRAAGRQLRLAQRVLPGRCRSPCSAWRWAVVFMPSAADGAAPALRPARLPAADRRAAGAVHRPVERPAGRLGRQPGGCSSSASPALAATRLRAVGAAHPDAAAEPAGLRQPRLRRRLRGGAGLWRQHLRHAPT